MGNYETHGGLGHWRQSGNCAESRRIARSEAGPLASTYEESGSGKVALSAQEAKVIAKLLLDRRARSFKYNSIVYMSFPARPAFSEVYARMTCCHLRDNAISLIQHASNRTYRVL